MICMHVPPGERIDSTADRMQALAGGSKEQVRCDFNGVVLLCNADTTKADILGQFNAEMAKRILPDADPVNHPAHYMMHPSGVECIQITEHLNFCLGNAVKYLWRAGAKGCQIEDLKKARWYIDREIARLEKEVAV